MSRLPWERDEGRAADTGICLSGGGLRAASFSFGVLQALQEKRGLIFGPKSARHLAAVSGGSYIAATYLLAARHRALHPAEYDTIPPLAEGSPEEAHILSHGRYLARGRLRFVGFGALNFLALIVLYAWAGTILAAAAMTGTALFESSFGRQWLGDFAALMDRLPAFVPAALVLASWLLAVRCLYADGGWRRRLLPLPGLIAIFVASPTVLQAAVTRQHWWSVGTMLYVVGGLLAFLFVVSGVTLSARRVGITGRAATALNTLSLWSSRSLGLTLLAWSAVRWYDWYAEAVRQDAAGTPQLYPLACLLATLVVLGPLFSHVPHRASLHREYRSRLMSCFAVRREAGAAILVPDALLTDLAPPQEDIHRFPRLLVCATANVRVRVPGRGPQTFVPFVLSHDVCGVPGHPEASLPTVKLELQQEPAGLFTWRKEPLVSLFTAVASTGAAVSPSMGRYTVPSLRVLIAAANLRLGRWIPNPFSTHARRAVLSAARPRWFRKDRRMESGYNELIPEMLGLDGPRVYVSDGGHYDNLGLLALLRAKCAEIWCVDASPEPSGQAEELRRVLAVAREEMGVDADIDLDRFAVTRDGFYGTTHAAGELRYPDGSPGRLFVMKLGLTRESSSVPRQRRYSDRGFPHHSTFWNQVYSTDRMDAYRRLGRDSASRCLNDNPPGPF